MEKVGNSFLNKKEINCHSLGCDEEGGCTTQCPEDGLAEPCACGANTMPVTRGESFAVVILGFANIS